jgi:hypothetical protein
LINPFKFNVIVLEGDLDILGYVTFIFICEFVSILHCFFNCFSLLEDALLGNFFLWNTTGFGRWEKLKDEVEGIVRDWEEDVELRGV